MNVPFGLVEWMILLMLPLFFRYILPTNGQYDSQGRVEYTGDFSGEPSLESTIGTNVFDKVNRLIYVVLRGKDPVEIRISPLVVLSLT